MAGRWLAYVAGPSSSCIGNSISVHATYTAVSNAKVSRALAHADRSKLNSSSLTAGQPSGLQWRFDEARQGKQFAIEQTEGDSTSVWRRVDRLQCAHSQYWFKSHLSTYSARWS